MRFGDFYILSLLIQGGAIVLLTLLIFIAAVKKVSHGKRIETTKKRFVDILTLAISKNRTSCNLIPFRKKYQIEALFQALEELDQHQKSAHWNALKKSLTSQYLMKFKSSYRKRALWKNRSLRARCIKLSPTQDDIPLLTHMIQDSSVFIRSLACEASVKLQSKPLLKKMLQQMSQGPKTNLYIYRNALSSGKERGMDMFLEIYQMLDKDDIQRDSCLEVILSQIQRQFVPKEPTLVRRSDYGKMQGLKPKNSRHLLTTKRKIHS